MIVMITVDYEVSARLAGPISVDMNLNSTVHVFVVLLVLS